MTPVKQAATEMVEDAQEIGGDYRRKDENEYRFAIVINGKEDNIGRVMNALGHSMAGLVGKSAADNDFCFIDYTDKDGNTHPSISHYPVIALKAKNSNQVLTAKSPSFILGNSRPLANVSPVSQIGPTISYAVASAAGFATGATA